MGACGVAVLALVGYCGIKLKNRSIAVILNIPYAVSEFCHIFCVVKTDSFLRYCGVHYPQCPPRIGK